MKWVSLIFLIVFLFQAEAVCQKCERIRKHNKEHPGKFEYYDDYKKSDEEDTEEEELDETKIALATG